ncbi:hypothetical protein NDN08_007878 [Rhodosorus marinus]|uniref:guanylate kinase n=1 Tax=Rhodosorus marinus TaxID=101924 RepID=A0AAV8UYS9_9RHOD|nr:hypothetical protein NDN08_007878 [Rhodosorus marinus]
MDRRIGFVCGSGFRVGGRRRKGVVCCGESKDKTKVIDGRGFFVPSEGQIVITPGKWPGQESVGLVDNVQLREDKTSAVVDVIELKSVGGSLYARPRNLSKQKRRWYDVADVRSATATVVEKQDAYLVNDVNDGYPVIPQVDPAKREQFLEEYAALKAKLLRQAAFTGAAGAAAVGIFASPFLGLTFGIGSVCGVGYLAFLQRATDRVGSGITINIGRFLLPVVPFVVLLILHNDGFQLFSLPKPEVLTAAVGFLSFRVPLFGQSAQELVSDLKQTKVKPRGTLSTMIATAQSMAEKRKADEANASAVARGNLVIISGCSGVGKSTMIRRLLKENPETLGFSVSTTTRAPRSSEVDGVDYNFVRREEFKDKVDRGEFLEWAEVHGNLYGTTEDSLEKIVGSGRTCVLDLDIQGVRMMSEKQIADALYIWVAPPDMDTLERRLRERGTEDEEILNTRLADALKEMTFAATTETFDYTIVNDSLESAYEKLKTIVQPVMV